MLRRTIAVAVTAVAAVGVLTGGPASASADEIDELVKKLQPKKRYAEYTPRWRVETRRFRFHHEGGKVVKKVWRVVMDGNKHVALLRTGDIQLLAFTPDSAKTKLNMPTGRYHLDTFMGPMISTNQFIQKKVYYTLQGDLDVNETDTWEKNAEAGTLTLIRSTKTDERHVVNRFVFSVDPVFGYQIDGHYRAAFSRLPKKRRFGGWAFCPGNYPPWKKDAIYDRTVYCPGGGRTDYVGWANNLINMDRCDADADKFTWRDGGFIAYLNPRTGWSPVRTREDGCPDVRMRLCNAHNDFHIHIPFPETLPTDEAGREVFTAHHRLMAIPPELTKHVWDNVKLIGKKQSGVIIKIGEKETFENQPVSLTEPARGIVWTAKHPPLSEKYARSGKKSLVIQGRQWPNLPQVGLLRNSRYVLEAYVKVEPWTGEELEKAKAKDARRREKLKRKGKELPPKVEWDNIKPEAYITADYYEWSPHSGKMLKKHRTNTATYGKDGWQRIAVELETPEWDPFVNITFHCRYGKAYMDDFHLKLVEDGNTTQEGVTAGEIEKTAQNPSSR
jgi:hypothetical protein